MFKKMDHNIPMTNCFPFVSFLFSFRLLEI